MPKTTRVMQSWQIFHFARKHLGRSVLYAIFGKKNARAVDYWCEDPRYTAKPEGAYDPIQGVKTLLEALDDLAHCGTVRSALAYLASGTSAAGDNVPEIVDLLSNISEEILADFRSVAALQRVIEAKEDIETVESYKNKAIEEIERTFARYRKDLE